MGSPGRVPPNDIGAEAAVLAACLLEKNAIDRVVDRLAPEHFYSEAHRRIFEGIIALTCVGTPIDIVNVASWLRERGRIDQVGGPSYLAELADAVPAVANIEAYAKTVRDCYRRRQTITVCQTIAAEGYGDVGETNEWIDSAEQRIYDIARTQERAGLEHIQPIAQAVVKEQMEAAQRGERITGQPTGFERLDGLIAGLHDGELYIVAARPGMGKTAFVCNIAVNVAFPVEQEPEDPGEPWEPVTPLPVAPGKGVCFFSLEMPKKQLAMRLLCAEARVELTKFRQGFLQDRDWGNLVSAAPTINALPLWINDTSAMSVLELRSEIRRKQAEYNVRDPRFPDDATKFIRRVALVIVDYLQLMTGPEEQREQEISAISRGLKNLAKELSVPVIALAQLNRTVETRSKDKRPQLSDLRESGAIEQDADTVIFLYRDDYYEDQSDMRGICEVIVGKSRNGPPGKVKVRFNGAYTRFDNLAPGEIDEFEEGRA